MKNIEIIIIYFYRYKIHKKTQFYDNNFFKEKLRENYYHLS